MQSSKYRYRLATAPGGKFQVQSSSFGQENWVRASLDCATVVEARVVMEALVARDDFVPELVDLVFTPSKEL